MDAAGEVAQFLEGGGQPVDDATELGRQLAGGGWHRRLRGTQLQRQRDQVLLGAVVEVALDPAAGGVGGGHDPGPGGPERGLGLGVGQGGADQLAEAGQPLLGAGR